ncbi:hypothetical protein DL95DRAFT_466428 [Leptodontidium sp. 2 PMI_412]|nr:hypothetical protein DL95DRAFT_466428 [Leptodontidium sp. 2 PMI_412]
MSCLKDNSCRIPLHTRRYLWPIQRSRKAQHVPNPLSGPGIIQSIYDLDLTTAEPPLYSEHTFHSIINQPVILKNGMCLRNTVYFSDTFADPILRTGQVTLYSPPLPAGFSGVYQEVGGFSAQGEIVGYNAEEFASAARNVDPAALR